MTSNRPFSFRLRHALLALAALAATAMVGTSPTEATLSAPAPSVSSGSRTLTVNQNQNLDPNGQTITVSGSGFDTNKGIYVAYCLEPRPGELPSPCGGGQDREGNTGASFWISSNPPSYGQGLAIPYGPGGSFSQTMHVSPLIGGVDCRRAQCVVVARNDHIRSSDRSQDVFIPLSFGEPAPPPQPDPDTPEPPPETTTTTLPQPLPDEERPPPESELGEDGRSVTAGELRLTADRTEELDPDGQSVIVTGAGFDEERGVRLAFCEVDEGEATETCLAGDAAVDLDDDEAVSMLDVSSNPSDEQRENSEPYGPSGSFGTKLIVQAEIDEDTDCRDTTCAIVTLPHPDRPLDRGQNLVLPVTFEVEEPPETTTTTEAPATTTTTVVAETPDEESSGGGSGPLIAIIAVLVIAGGTGGAVWYRRTRTPSGEAS